jgi:hypothetical protein
MLWIYIDVHEYMYFLLNLNILCIICSTGSFTSSTVGSEQNIILWQSNSNLVPDVITLVYTHSYLHLVV